MSDGSIVDALDTETLLEAVDIGDLLEEVDVDELAERDEVGVAIAEIGAVLGREFGRELGREFGAVIARAISERPPSDELIEDSKEAIRDAFRGLFADPDARASLKEDLTAIGKEQVSGELIEDAVSDALGESEDTDEAGGEAAEREEDDGTGKDEGGEGMEAEESDEGEQEVDEETGEGTETEDEAGVDEEPELSSREDLGELSYRELQSLAKDHDIKANLSRDEMTDELIEALDLEG